MRVTVIRENEAGQRLDKYLHKYLKEAQSSFLYKMLRKKNITRNGKKASGCEKLEVGDEIRFFMAEETLDKFMGIVNAVNKNTQNEEETQPAEELKADEVLRAFKKYGEFEVVFENRHILIVNKPAGILTQKAYSDDLSLNEWLIGRMLFYGEITEEELHTFKPSVCNRLDRNTSGMVICGKTLPGSQKMTELLRNRSLHKFYRAYVKGEVKEASYIEGSLKKNYKTNTVKLVNSTDDAEGSAFIQTRYEPVKVWEDRTLLEVELLTGRTHQIRAHLAGIGHPIIGDYKYGDKGINDSYKNKYGIKSQLLHAYRLKFPQLDGEFEDMSGITVTAEPPEIFCILNGQEGGVDDKCQHGIQEG